MLARCGYRESLMIPDVTSLYYRARTRLIDKPSAGPALIPHIPAREDTGDSISGSDTYNIDTVRWSEQQAAQLRRQAADEMLNDQLDWENIAQEIEGLAKSERSQLAKNIRTVIEHLARLQVSPAKLPRNNWKETIIRTRENIEDVLKSSPVLRPSVDAVVAEEHSKALRVVRRVLELHNELPEVPLQTIGYTSEQVTGDWFPPDPR